MDTTGGDSAWILEVLLVEDRKTPWLMMLDWLLRSKSCGECFPRRTAAERPTHGQ
jgi:hypothetical protein